MTTTNTLNLIKTKSPIMPPGPFYIAREGYPFILISLFLSLIFLWLFWPLGVVFGLGFLFCVYFFRDPRRACPINTESVLSPADGKVLKVEKINSSPYLDQVHQKVSIFMSGFDVHVNRIPCEGQVESIHYHHGKFFVASLDKASEHNERNTVVLKTQNTGDLVAFTQIAGLVARRIVCYLQKGMKVAQGERYGMIRFGSRMEVSIPLSWQVLVNPGQKVKAGLTVLAKVPLLPKGEGARRADEGSK